LTQSHMSFDIRERSLSLFAANKKPAERRVGLGAPMMRRLSIAITTIRSHRQLNFQAAAPKEDPDDLQPAPA
jgi:hypothetical protein